MNSKVSRRVLQVFLTILGSVAFVAGATTVVLGVDSIVGAETVSATVDSEMRFYAVWYAGAGLVLVRAASRVEESATVIRGISVLLFVAGCSRGLSWMMVGEPHTVAQVLMIIELALPFVIVAWQAAIAGNHQERS
jgi:hypothetical protein